VKRLRQTVIVKVKVQVNVIYPLSMIHGVYPTPTRTTVRKLEQSFFPTIILQKYQARYAGGGGEEESKRTRTREPEERERTGM
jgi:hypothetical protein